MLGKLLASPVLTFDSTQCRSFSAVTPNIQPARIRGKAWISVYTSKKWEVQSIAETQTTLLGDEESKMWEACRQPLSAFKLSDEEEDKILGKAFGQLHSPYWGEERMKEVPKVEVVNEILDYLRGLGLSDEDLFKLLKKFPEVLGCSLDNELRNNVQILEKEWGIKGKTLRNLLLRNPKVLGYIVDCKGDCMAKCTRCWASSSQYLASPWSINPCMKRTIARDTRNNILKKITEDDNLIKERVRDLTNLATLLAEGRFKTS